MDHYHIFLIMTGLTGLIRFVMLEKMKEEKIRQEKVKENNVRP